MRRSFRIVWVDPKSNAKNPYKRHTEEGHNEEKSVWRGGRDWCGVAIAKNASSHWTLEEARTGLSPGVLVGSTILTVDSLWQNEFPFLQANKFAYLLHIC